MCSTSLHIILLFCLHLCNGLIPLGIDSGYQHLLQEVNSMVFSFDQSKIETKWFEQPIDHYNGSDDRTLPMRYFERLEYWKPDGPIYLFIGGEGEATEAFLQTGLMYELAKETNGAMFLCEHRYYGKSMPLDAFNIENLKHLNTRQALTDISRLLLHIKSEPKFKSSRVVVVGGSYAGNLAAWVKLVYPKLIDAAIASSAPVVAKKEFYEYLENVSEDFEQYGTENCIDTIAKIFRRYDELFKTPEGIKTLKAEEQICENTDMNRDENKQIFFLDKSIAFMQTAQYGNPEMINDHCESLITKLALKSKREGVLWSPNNNCFDYDFDRMLESMKDTDYALAWTYQTCTEFGYYPTSSSDKQPFTKNIRIDLFYKICSGLFGPTFDEKRIDDGVKHTNRCYGGLKPNVSHVVFVNGDLDPYHKLGILEDVSYDAPAKVIHQASHCRDLFSKRPNDSEELKRAREYIKYLIKRWIGAGDYKKPE